MWLSEKIASPGQSRETAMLGTVSVPGNDAAVVTDGERRNAKVISPGGYCWQPSENDSVLVLKGGEILVPGVLQKSCDLSPGEVMIFAEGCSVLLKNDGSIHLCGNVKVEGKLYLNGEEVTGE